MPSPRLVTYLAIVMSSASLVAQDLPRPHLPVVDLEGREQARLFAERGGVSYSLQRNDGTWTAPIAADYTLKLRYAEFDPLDGQPPVPANLRADGDNRLFIVQYHTQGLSRYRDAIEAAGADNRLFLANYANVWEMSLELAATVRELPFVRAVVPFHPAYKLEAPLRHALAQGAPAGRLLRVNLLTTTRAAADKLAVRQFVEARDGSVDEVSEPTHLMSVTVRLGDLPALAALDAVQWIDRWSAPEEDMDIAREFHGMNHVETQASIRGQGVRVEVMDGGCDENHPDLQNFAVHGGNTPSAHGTATSGIVVGSGANNSAATGALPDAFLSIADYSFFSGGSRYAHTGELVNPALSWQCVLQSNSWGNARTTSYTSISQDMDLILFDHARISILQSQSNAGNQDSRPQAWAKNIISVGGIRHQNTLTKADDNWSFGASIGPAADGRIKPDLASFYDSILTTDQVGSAGYSSGNYTSTFGGTSGATPICAGMLGGFYQLWHQGVFGNPNGGSTVFANAPNNTTAKAVLINTASQWSFSGTSHDLTRMHQGWGHPDLQRMYDGRSDMLIIDESVVLTNLQSNVHAVNVNAGTAELKVTMVYRDPPGTTSSSLHRINNLDLRVTSPSSVVYWGNNGLTAGNYSSSGGSANTVDTVENVFVQNPQAGTWNIEVIAAELNQDSHVETGALDCDYALVVSGVDATPPTLPADPTNLSATATGADTIQLDWDDNSNDENGFTIERSLDGTNFSVLTSVGANVTSHVDGGLAASTTYWYRVFAFNGAGSSGTTNVANATTNALPPPADPSNLSASATAADTIQLDWDDNSNNESGFTIERSLDGTSFSVLTSVGANVTSHVDGGLTAGTTYWYRVFAFNGAGSSGTTNVANATTPSGSDFLATSESTGRGTVVGNLSQTWTDDDAYEALTEAPQGPRNRLQHEWTIDNVPSSGTRTLHFQAHRSSGPSADAFEVQVRRRNRWVDTFVVTKTVDDDTYQTWVLPSNVSGSVRIRVLDSQTQKNEPGGLDTLFVDHIFIRAQ